MTDFPERMGDIDERPRPHGIVSSSAPSCRLYDIVYGHFVGDVALNTVRQDPLMGNIARRRMRHHGHSRNIVDGNTAHYEGKNLQTVAIFQDDWTRFGLLDEHVVALQGIGDQLLVGQRGMLLDGVSLASDVAGNTKDFGGRPLDQDGLLDIYSSVPWTFDYKGRLNLRSLTMVVHPDMMDKVTKLAESIHEHPRWPHVFARKFEEWKASRRARRLEAREVE